MEELRVDATGLELRLAAAAAVAREAGLLARGLFESGLAATLKSRQDYVTAADARVERFIRARLAALFPGDAIVGEELGGVGSARTWVVDPIDGTANFAHRHPGFAVSIGFLDGGVPAAGAIHVPMTDTLYTARLGGGAFRNAQSIAASACDLPERAYVELGYSPRSPRADYLRTLEALLDGGMLARWSGSAALALAQVAEGSSDGYLELHLNPWDVAAGLVLVREAGGITSDFFAGEGATAGNPLLAAAPAFHPVFANAVMDALAGSPLARPCHGLPGGGH